MPDANLHQVGRQRRVRLCNQCRQRLGKLELCQKHLQVRGGRGSASGAVNP